MIIYHRTSILDSTAKIAVNTVNCVGIMGKGLAHAYKKRYPQMFKQYKQYCDDGLLEPGKLWLWKGDNQWVLNFPTKRHWRNRSKLEWIEAGLKKFVDNYESKGIDQISFPKLGCGNGNLDWDEVRPVMEHYLNPLPIEVFIHDYQADIGIPEHLAEFIVENNQRDIPISSSDLWTNIRLIDDKVGANLVDFESNRPFRIKTFEDDLLIEGTTDRTFFSREEVVSIWCILQGGILTKKKIGISNPYEASHIISLFSLLPRVIPVNIAFAGCHSHGLNEVAAEIQFSNKIKQPSLSEQREIAWH